MWWNPMNEELEISQTICKISTLHNTTTNSSVLTMNTRVTNINSSRWQSLSTKKMSLTVPKKRPSSFGNFEAKLIVNFEKMYFKDCWKKALNEFQKVFIENRIPKCFWKFFRQSCPHRQRKLFSEYFRYLSKYSTTIKNSSETFQNTLRKMVRIYSILVQIDNECTVILKRFRNSQFLFRNPQNALESFR
jgi:hypothetical protein